MQAEPIEFHSNSVGFKFSLFLISQKLYVFLFCFRIFKTIFVADKGNVYCNDANETTLHCDITIFKWFTINLNVSLFAYYFHRNFSPTNISNASKLFFILKCVDVGCIEFFFRFFFNQSTLSCM